MARKRQPAKTSSGAPAKKISKSKAKAKSGKEEQQQEQVEQDVELNENQSMDQEILDDQQNQGSNNGDQDDDDDDDDQDDDDDDQDDSEQQSSVPEVKPQNYAVKQMQFRERRGTKMNALINRKKQQEEDSFWAQHKGYFGDLNASDDEEQEDYVQSSSGRDQFDSDFGATESQHNDEQEQQNKKMDEEDEEKAKQKKRRSELMKKINVSKDVVEKKQQTISKRPKAQAKQEQPTNRYIHQMFSQEELLGQAAHTQYINWVSLKKLISIQTQKKDFTRKSKHVDGNKIIFRDKLGSDGNRQVTYELSGVQVKDISDLSEYWKAK